MFRRRWFLVERGRGGFLLSDVVIESNILLLWRRNNLLLFLFGLTHLLVVVLRLVLGRREGGGRKGSRRWGRRRGNRGGYPLHRGREWEEKAWVRMGRVVVGKPTQELRVDRLEMVV
jgi:hypothetical protein